MVKQVITVGGSANDHTGEGLRDGLVKANANFSELYAQGGTVYTATGSRYWLPINNFSTATPVAPGSGSIRLFPAYIGSQITISSLNARVATTSAGGNFQLAIYAASATTNFPTGSALVSTASISTTSGGMQGASASLQLGPGLYWFASNSDNGTSALNSVGTSSVLMSQVVGVFGAANVFAACTGLSVTQTYNTWPDLTATSWSSSNEVTTASVPLVAFQIASVP